MYYAHYDQVKKQGQDLNIHLNEVARQMAEEFPVLSFSGVDTEKLRQIFIAVGLYHDIGKLMRAFQTYLKTDRGGIEKNHALISAGIFSAKYEKEKDVAVYLGVLAIARHHGDLVGDIETNNGFFTQLAQQYEDLAIQGAGQKEYAALLEGAAFSLPQFKAFLERSASFLRSKRNLEKNGVKNFFLLQYLFSKLIWADKLDSAGLTPNAGCLAALANVEAYIKSKNGIAMRVNEKREKIRQDVIGRITSLSDETFHTRRIYQLTAPTGTGKTLTSICAGLCIMERMQKMYGCRPQIITALPFINILEQTKIDYEAFFDDVLVHYSGADLERGHGGQEESPLAQKLLLLSAWESPVIITTFVQLFSSILTSKNQRLIKLNRLAGSVVILDEIQALPAKYMPLLGAVIKHLADFYGTRFILMTATQPEIVSAANHLLKQEEMEAYELLLAHEEYYCELKRTELICVMDEVTSNETLVDFINKTKPSAASALVVVNTIKQSIEVYKALQTNHRTLYLSTNLMPVDRKRVIAEAARLLKEKEPFILVSTQTIEAGVDLDFDIGYRDLAPLPSIIQVAGRINRSGQKGEYLPLYIFHTDSTKRVYDQYPVQETYKILQGNKRVGEDGYLELIQCYYKRIAASNQFDREIYQAMYTLDYSEIEKFELIEKQENIKTVLFICSEFVAEKTREAVDLFKLFHLDFEQKARLKQILNQLGAYTVDIRVQNLVKNRPCKFSEIYGVNLDWYVVQTDEMENYYGETGFMAESPQAFVY